MKRFVLIFFVTVMLFICTSCNTSFEVDNATDTKKDSTPSEGLEFTYSSELSSYVVSGIGTCTDKDIVIPDTYRGIKVGGIEEEAFDDLDLKSVEIPNSISRIGELAFSGNPDIRKVVDGVIYIDDWVIGCNSSSKDIKIRKGTVGIADFAFDYSKNITSVTIPDSVKYIGQYAFEHCVNLNRVDLSTNLLHIDNGAFADCTSLMNIDLPSSLVSIGSGAFENCSNLIRIEEGISYVENWIVDCDTEIKNINISNETVGISSYAFRGLKRSVKFIIPEGVKYICSYAICGCRYVSEISIPSSVEKIGYLAFYNSFTYKFEVSKDNPYYSSVNNNLYSKDGSIFIFFAHKVYNYSFKVPEGVVAIADGAFYNQDEVDVVKLPESLISIGSDSFYNSAIYSIEIPNGVTQIGERAFMDSSLFGDIVLSNNIESIEKGTFENCSFTEIRIPKSVNYINPTAFSGCWNLSNIIYDGTISEWNKLLKESNINSFGDYTIHCSDGTLTD